MMGQLLLLLDFLQAEVGVEVEDQSKGDQAGLVVVEPAVQEEAEHRGKVLMVAQDLILKAGKAVEVVEAKVPLARMVELLLVPAVLVETGRLVL
jgi:hypothetical protein